jgi:hypothetical protein
MNEQLAKSKAFFTAEYAKKTKIKTFAPLATSAVKHGI